MITASGMVVNGVGPDCDANPCLGVMESQASVGAPLGYADTGPVINRKLDKTHRTNFMSAECQVPLDGTGPTCNRSTPKNDRS